MIKQKCFSYIAAPINEMYPGIYIHSNVVLVQLKPDHFEMDNKKEKAICADDDEDDI